MFTLLKWMIGTLLTLVLLLAVAVVIVPRVLDPNDYRETLAELVKQQTNRDLVLGGDLSISVFPWLGVRTQSLSLSQPEQLSLEREPMLEVETAQLRVKLLPLFAKRLEIDTVVLDGPRLRLITLQNGTNSFSGLTGETDTPPTAPASRQNQDNSSLAVALVIQGLEITDGELLWDDRQAGQKYTAKGLKVSTGNLIGDSLTDFEISGVVSDASNPQQISLRSSGKALIDTNSLDITANDINAEFSQSGQSLKFSAAVMGIDSAQNIVANDLQVSGSLRSESPDSPNTEFDSRLSSARLSSNNGELTLLELDANLLIKVLDQPDADLRLQLPEMLFDVNTQRLSSQSLSLNGKIGDRPVEFDMSNLMVDLSQQTMSATQLRLRSNDLNANIEGLNATEIFDEPLARGKITAAPFNAAQLLKDFELNYVPKDQAALRAVALKGDFIAALDKVSLSNMQLQIDQSQLLGQFSAENFNKPELRFDLELDAIDLDRYLPVDEPVGAANQQVGSTAEALVVPMAMFNQVAANGAFKAEQLISGGIQLNDIDVQISSTPGKVSIVPRANLYDGKMTGSMTFDQSGETSKLQIKNEIDLISLAKFLQAADVTDQLSGIGSLVLDLTVTEVDGVQNNSGTIKLFAKNGALKGIDIKNIVDSGYQQYKQLRGKESTDEEGSGEVNDETRFAELLGTFNIDNFMLSNKDFNLKAPLFRISGQGDIDIKAETVDYLVNVAVVNSTDGQGGEALDKLKGISLPIRFSGSMFSPNYSLDMKALYKGLVKNEVEEKKAEYVREKLGIETDKPLSTKEILQQALLKKLDKKNRNSQPEETLTIEPPGSSQGSHQGSSQTSESEPEVIDYPEETITIVPPGSNRQSSNANPAVPDVSADPNAEQVNSELEDKRTERQRRKDELKKRLLEELFN